MELPDISIATIAKITAIEAEAYRFMEWLRWPDGEPVCPHCDVKGNSVYLEPRNGGRKTRSGKISERRVWQCRDCRKQFTAIVGTVFERSHLPLQKWLLGMYMMFTARNGVSAHELSRALDITIKAAWFMGHRLRFAMEDEGREPLEGVVEADETYIGGHAKFMHEKDRRRKFGESRGVTGKTAVVTLVSRDGEARSRVMEKVDGDNIGSFLSENADSSAVLMTDEAHHFSPSGPQFAAHYIVDHRKGQYARQRGKITTNTAEGFFSQLKRSIDGTHHQVSKRHLERYVAEFDYKYNTREMKDAERMGLAVQKAQGKRLMYDRVVKEGCSEA